MDGSAGLVISISPASKQLDDPVTSHCHEAVDHGIQPEQYAKSPHRGHPITADIVMHVHYVSFVAEALVETLSQSTTSGRDFRED